MNGRTEEREHRPPAHKRQPDTSGRQILDSQLEFDITSGETLEDALEAYAQLATAMVLGGARREN